MNSFFSFFVKLYWFFRYLFHEFLYAISACAKPLFSAFVVAIACFIDQYKYGGSHIKFFALFMFFAVLYDIYYRMDWVAYWREMMYSRVKASRLTRKDLMILKEKLRGGKDKPGSCEGNLVKVGLSVKRSGDRVEGEGPVQQKESL